ncbi:predicted protein [Aspergillus nidulans FGSC A4]|uniref:Uncharacterized protein n=1 Tax=Emericella nidulans (strain FGSC A4 / ATCC 38163 / CBS 112.46 / NRRL 194 / M139) TaxID=227321 RepID=Q5B4E2_EMENI|nr:hypothetical protein [Aspergillus nidulans FGSC A4]EAA60931.1 predicted protein [Aspergillus nidulans FGSC A4]CBF77197.1 TPA: conserved hypothetical protein [Aspergillus nidulans FGSC A4]|eukprot:XP_662192.1 predicted protein [Aspergillus nidulans FGSC A4]
MTRAGSDAVIAAAAGSEKDLHCRLRCSWFRWCIAAARIPRARAVLKDVMSKLRPSLESQYNYDMRVDSLLDPSVDDTVIGPAENNGQQMTAIPVNFESGQLPFLVVKHGGLSLLAWNFWTSSLAMLPTVLRQPVWLCMPFVQQPDPGREWGVAFHLQPADGSLEPRGSFADVAFLRKVKLEALRLV